MSKRTVRPESFAKKLDQFYTNEAYARHFIEVTQRVCGDLQQFSLIIEPSAGTGSFLKHLPNNSIGYDIDPQSSSIVAQDFLEVKHKPDNILVIGNPPFGKVSSLAIKFFNHSASFANVIAFILPKTFRKSSVINRLDLYFSLIYDEEVPEHSFILEGVPYNVACCAQIWLKSDLERPLIPIMRLSQLKQFFRIVSAQQADFAIQRVGANAGRIKYDNFVGLSPLSNYFIKVFDKKVISIFQNINFDIVKYNTAGNPSISPSELASLWVKKASEMKLFINIVLDIPESF
jgi:predicted RNA methylase